MNQCKNVPMLTFTGESSLYPFTKYGEPFFFCSLHRLPASCVYSHVTLFPVPYKLCHILTHVSREDCSCFFKDFEIF